MRKKGLLFFLVLGMGLTVAAFAAQRVVVCEEVYAEY